MRATPMGLAALVGLAACAHGAGEPAAMGDVVEFDLRELSGRRVRGRDLRGRTVLLDVWATWCEPCQRSLPFYADLRARLSGYRFEVVTVSIDDDAEALVRYLRDRRFPFPVLRDPQADLLARLGATGVPATVLLDPHGRLVFRHEGFMPGDADRIERAVRYVLRESEPSGPTR